MEGDKNPDWTAELASDTAALKVALKCENGWLWTDSPDPNEMHPIHCINWFEAFAFAAYSQWHEIFRGIRCARLDRTVP